MISRKRPASQSWTRIRPSFGQGAKGAKGAFFKRLFAPGVADSPKLIQTNSTPDTPLTPLHPYHVQQSKDPAGQLARADSRRALT